ncbi:MAG: undecaprenyl-diphosphate phosphatase [Clostridia bacterium]|nr:undecaprenyl-diphosphate phosphatase [Clostridia bacterium]
MTILQASLLGFTQGLTEFLPISSSGHLVLLRALMGIDTGQVSADALLLLDVFLHIGTLLAVFIVLRKEWINALRHPIQSGTLLMLFIASLPALAAVIFFKDTVESFFTGRYLGAAFTVTALFLIIADIVSRKRENKNKAKRRIGPVNAVIMGIFQAIALIPGVSRSGLTLSGGVFSGLDRKSAVKFAFMMSAPAILGSLVFTGKKAWDSGLLKQMEWQPALAGFIAAAVSGLLAIRFLLRLVKKTPLTWFSLYLAIVGIAVTVVQLIDPTFLNLS